MTAHHPALTPARRRKDGPSEAVRAIAGAVIGSLGHRFLKQQGKPANRVFIPLETLAQGVAMSDGKRIPPYSEPVIRRLARDYDYRLAPIVVRWSGGLTHQIVLGLSVMDAAETGGSPALVVDLGEPG